jgi:hypothetical protein
MAFNFTLDQIDHALEWVLRDAVIAAGYWPDQRALLAAGATDADFAAAKAAILAAGRPLMEVLGVGPWQDRGELNGNNLVLSRGPDGRGSYGISQPIVYEQIDPLDKRAGYRELLLAREPQRLRYEVRFVSDDVDMDRVGTQLWLTCFGVPTYYRGINDDLTKMKEGFEVMRVGDGVDMSSDKYIERVWRFDVLDVVLIPARQLDTVPAAVELGVNLSVGPVAQGGSLPAYLLVIKDDMFPPGHKAFFNYPFFEYPFWG